MSKPVILTGIRSNGELTLGNYLGAILPAIELQKKHAGEYQLNMFVPDLHSFTTPVEHGELYQNTLDNLRLFAAAGLDIDQPDTYIYRQSFIPAHSELTWILSCFTSFGELRRMTQFKDKATILMEYEGQSYKVGTEEGLELNKDQEADIEVLVSKDDLPYEHLTVRAGLFIYPVLMAADILLYGAQWVPVGEDQRQHLELTRDVALRMNNKFGELFVVPEEWNKQVEFAARKDGIRIRSLRNPEKKMSKSVEDPAGTILLNDDPEGAAKKVMAATTDSFGSIKYDFERQAGVANLMTISALLAGRAVDDVAHEWEGKSSYGELKGHVAEQVKGFLSDLQSKYAAVDENQIRSKLEQDEAAMRAYADETLMKVQRAVGLRAA